MARRLIYTMLPLALLCLTLAGCGGNQTVTVEAEHSCAASAFLAFTNAGQGDLLLEGWVLRDGSGEYRLPSQRLAPGARLRVWRGTGQSDEVNYYLGQPEASWQLANGTSLSVERHDPWPWGNVQAFWLSCQSDPRP